SSSLPEFLVAMGILGLGSGLLDVAPAAVVGDVVEGRGGPVFAAYSMSGDLANVVGPVTTGALAEVAFGDAFALTAAILAGATAMGIAMPETRGLGQNQLDQSRPEVGEQVLGALDADREPDEVAPDDIAVPAEVLRRRVHDDVGTELQRTLQSRRGEGVVDDEPRARVLGDAGECRDVGNVQQRVGRCLAPDDARRLA